MSLTKAEEEARELYHLYKTTANQYAFITTVKATKLYGADEAELMWCCFDAVHDLNEVTPHDKAAKDETRTQVALTEIAKAKVVTDSGKNANTIFEMVRLAKEALRSSSHTE